MRHILSPRNLPVLEQFAFRNVLLAFDFDGTLAPLVSVPDGAAIRPSTRRLLRALASLYPCIVVSGRSRADVLRRLRGIGFQEVIGNHGIEPRDSSRDIAREVESWIPVLNRKLRAIRGVVLESKTFTLSLHYRKARNRRQALKAILNAARTLSGSRLIGGKQVVNVIPKGAPDKGLAVERERKHRHCDNVIYVGDDETDESVFACGLPSRYLTIRVGVKKSSSASYFLRNQREIDRLLKFLVEIRSLGSSRLSA
ncbi:MAG TPA: trehalose-phosphatase [Verrucomicrobiae bacterium]|nr:trehalose-phosphatase [Verrucomicrobiae bacterium]